MYNTAYIHFGGMKFGVVLCSRCNTARGVGLDVKTAECPRCGKRLDMKKTRILCRAETESEVAKAVMEYNIKLGDGEDIYEQDIKVIKDKHGNIGLIRNKKPSDVYGLVVGKLNFIKGHDDKVVAAARELCRYLGHFTEYDMNEVLKHLDFYGEGVCERYITRLIENNVIYEPKTGMYRCV